MHHKKLGGKDMAFQIGCLTGPGHQLGTVAIKLSPV